MKHELRRYFLLRRRKGTLPGDQSLLLNERALFWSLLVIHLVFLWTWKFFPTADGPAHLFNALILDRLDSQQWRYGEYFTVGSRLIPNLASHYLLTGLMWIFPPLIAERVLVSLFTLGLPLAYRFFLRTIGDDFRFWSSFCFLFLFVRVCLLGFYSYCLSAVLLLLAITFCIRHRENFGVRKSVLLCLLLIGTFFTHLVGYALACSAIIWLALTIQPRSRSRAMCMCAAVAATLPLPIRYFWATDFVGQNEGTGRIIEHLNFLNLWSFVDFQFGRLNSWFFASYEADNGWFFWMVALTFQVLVFTCLGAQKRAPSETASTAEIRASIAIFGVGVALLLILLPDHLGRHGSFLHDRLAILPPLFWLACCRPPGRMLIRNLCLAGIFGLVILNLVLVSRSFAAANTELAQFTTGVAQVGRHTTIRVKTPRDTSLVRYLSSAGSYYCLTTGNVDLGNYEASKDHFPVRWRNASVQAEEPETYIIWTHAGQDAPIPVGYRRTWRKGRLSICQRKRTLGSYGVGAGILRAPNP